MAGGSIEAVQRAEAILLQMGRRVFHVGPVGSGGAAKLCNNLMASINLVGTSEVIGLGMRYICFHLFLIFGSLEDFVFHEKKFNISSPWTAESFEYRSRS